MLTPAASACCLFPFCGGWGWGVPGYAYNYNYAPAVYAYNPPANYTVGYGGFSSYAGYGAACCQTNCCQSSCGSSCVGSCGNSSCGESEILKRPVADPISNEDRTFGTDKDRAGTYDSTTPRSTIPRTETEPGDTFSRPGTTPGGWNGGSGINSRSNSGGLFNEDLPDPNSGLGSDPVRSAPPAFDQRSIKPPMNMPVDEEPVKSPVDDVPAETQPSSTTEPDASKEVSPKDFLAPETTRAPVSDRLLAQFRSRHTDAVPMQRLATGQKRSEQSGSRISSSETEIRPLRWISAPAPAGRVSL